MDKRVTLALGLVACAMLVVPALAQQEGETPEMSTEMQEEMAAWMALAQPGVHHEHLAPFVGTWKGDVRMWMGPDSPEMTAESHAEVDWIMDGRFLEWQHSGDFGGMPYESRAIEGYNNGDKRYEASWVDNFGTLILYFEGSCSADGKSREMTASWNDAVGGGGKVGYRTVYDWVDADTFTYTAYVDKGDGEFKNTVITYTRQ